MRCTALIFVLSFPLVFVAVDAQTLSDADIQAAIKAGEARRFNNLISECTANAGFGEAFAAGLAGGVRRNGGFDVTVSTNAGRIASLAADAKRLYKQFGPEQLTDDLKVPAVFVSVEPQNPSRGSGSISVASVIESVVLKSKSNEAAVVQPVSFDTEPVEWSNLLGGKVEGNRAIAGSITRKCASYRLEISTS